MLSSRFSRITISFARPRGCWMALTGRPTTILPSSAISGRKPQAVRSPSTATRLKSSAVSVRKKVFGRSWNSRLFVPASVSKPSSSVAAAALRFVMQHVVVCQHHVRRNEETGPERARLARQPHDDPADGACRAQPGLKETDGKKVARLADDRLEKLVINACRGDAPAGDL